MKRHAAAKRAAPSGEVPAAEYVPIGKLLPWLQNPRKNDAAVDPVMRSMQEFGFGAPIIARLANGEIIGGHTRLKAAAKLGMKTVPVRYLDLTEKQAHALALADNKLGEIADWDEAVLAAVLADYDASELEVTGFSTDELAELLKPDLEDAVDDADLTPPENPESVLGEVYELGPHRLVCGDSRFPEPWKALLGRERLRCLWTDPPYGVSYVGKTADALTMDNDELPPEKLHALLTAVLDHALAHSEGGAAWYLAGPAGPLGQVFGDILGRLGVWRETLVWEKDQFVMGRSDYHYRHEPIFYGWVPGKAHYWSGARDLDSILKFDRPRQSTDHPTMKPPELVQHCLRNSSKAGWLVGDPFGGSGTSLIAAAREGRRARLIELSPGYCDVIRRRWGAFARSAGIEPGPGAL